MAKERINIDEIKLSNGKKVEEFTDEELNEVVGGATTMFPPQRPWTCQCGHYNDTTEYDEGRNRHVFVRHCVICGQPRHK
ncbi:MAG: hypothetical protein KBA53_01650 [Thermoclostridium sp.]|nr:hypothetical protein [Thermoclostridium sp.]